jgi:DNA-binding IclR family transcriptional regulator
VRIQNGESVLARAVRIFEAFTPEESALTVSEISRRTGLHVATASRLVAELVSYGFLARDADRRVKVGMRLWELATRASPSLSLRNAAMPFMEGIHDVVGHHVQLGVLNGDDVLFLERLTARGAVINYTRIAGRLPLHASSSGLVLLAHGPVDLRERVLDGPLHRYTPGHTRHRGPAAGRAGRGPPAGLRVLPGVRAPGRPGYRGAGARRPR